MTHPRRHGRPPNKRRAPNLGPRAATAFARLVRVMATLRSPAGCPWDREQTHASLRPHLLEETYEAIETIDRGDLDALPAELGDVLFQCVFHAQIAVEDGRFDIVDAVDAITQKLIRRHPHVFTPSGRPLASGARRNSRIRTATAVKEQWEIIKAGEQATAGTARRVLKGVPRSLPSLQRAHEIGRRVAAVGFDWAHAEDVLDKMDEELRELRAAMAESPARASEELGDFLFSLANLARKLGIEPESSLRTANDKFTRRFDALEEWFERQGRTVHGASLEELEAGWKAIKQRQKTEGRKPRLTSRSSARPRSGPSSRER
jgi:nucleoside triphosphate diphosphatase